MSIDDDVRETVDTPQIPRPRPPEEAEGHFPWPEPWHSSRGARPRTEYWDAETATWRSRGPIVQPR